MNGRGLGTREKKSDLRVSEGSASRTQGEGPGQLEIDAEGARAELGETPFFWTFPRPNGGFTPLREITVCAPFPTQGHTDAQGSRSVGPAMGRGGSPTSNPAEEAGDIWNSHSWALKQLHFNICKMGQLTQKAGYLEKCK